MPSVGIHFFGRFGNQMFQYATARAYAEKYNASFHTPPWFGQEIFELNDRTYKPMPMTGLEALPGTTDITLQGYFQHEDAMKLLSVQKLRQWFKLQPRWQNLVKQVDLAAHLRHSDYINLSNIYCLIPKESYTKACCKNGLIPDNITWVGEDFKNPVTVAGHLGFLPDFITMMTAKTLLRANSSFSWWAATLNPGTIYSPVVEARTGWNDVEFVPGNWPRIADSSKCNCKLTDLHVSS